MDRFSVWLAELPLTSRIALALVVLGVGLYAVGLRGVVVTPWPHLAALLASALAN